MIRLFSVYFLRCINIRTFSVQCIRHGPQRLCQFWGNNSKARCLKMVTSLLLCFIVPFQFFYCCYLDLYIIILNKHNFAKALLYMHYLIFTETHTNICTSTSTDHTADEIKLMKAKKWSVVTTKTFNSNAFFDIQLLPWNLNESIKSSSICQLPIQR